MTVKLRLARTALSRNNPSYSIVAIPSTLRITAKPLEILGSYHSIPTLPLPLPVSPNGSHRSIKEWGPGQYNSSSSSLGEGMTKVGEKRVDWNEGRVRWWLSRGAVPSKRVERLLISAGILNTTILPPVVASSPKKPVISRKRRLREAVNEMSMRMLKHKGTSSL